MRLTKADFEDMKYKYMIYGAFWVFVLMVFISIMYAHYSNEAPEIVCVCQGVLLG